MILTDRLKHTIPQGVDPEQALKEKAKNIPLGRIGKPEELAALVRRGGIPVEVGEQLALCLVTGAPKRVSKRTKRLTDAVIEVWALTAAGETPNAAIKAVCSRYGDIDESVLDNAALRRCRRDVNAELRRRGFVSYDAIPMN